MKNSKSKEEWMTCPNVDLDWPGLAYLCPLSKLIVARKRDALHQLFGGNFNGYVIYNGQGEKVFLAVQKKMGKKVEIKVFNYYGNEVINLKKRHECCMNSILIWSPPGNFVGTIKNGKCFRHYNIENNSGEVFLKIKSRGIFCCVYNIIHGGKSVGKLIKRDFQNNEILFPVDMSVQQKSILLGACFLPRFLT